MKGKPFLPKRQYEERIVAFIDILGFASIIKGTSKGNRNAQKNLGQIVDALDCIHSHFNNLKENNIGSSLQLSQFSDSIVISVLNNTKEIVEMCKKIKYIQVHLLCEYNILIRGGIVKGKLMHTDDLLLGPAMINAYNLESKCALSPRIVIDPKVWWVYNKVNKAEDGEVIDKEKVYKKDFDGTYYIDYFNDNYDFYVEDEKKYFSCMCELIRDNINNADISIRMKYLWMREKLKKSLNYSRYEHIYKEIVTQKSGKKT